MAVYLNMHEVLAQCCNDKKVKLISRIMIYQK